MYKAPLHDQKAPFVAEVTFFNRQERREILTSYLAAYYRASNNRDDENEAGPTGEDAEADINVRDNVADALHALFLDHEECKSKRAVRDLLDSAETEDDESILKKLFDWADKLICRAQKDKSSVRLEASTGGELLKNLTPFATYDEDDEGDRDVSYWPLVSLISYHFDDPITRLGIVLLDTPGVSDGNRTRRVSAGKHRQTRTHAAIVTDAARARDDMTVSREVRLMRHRGPGRVIVISPKADVIGESTMPSGSKRDRDEVDKLKKRVAKLEAEMNSIDIQMASGSVGERSDMFKSKLEMEVKLKSAQNAEKA